ncbi:alpha/beta fold hydrolase [Pseudomonas sp. Gutcm_11s]|uniref:alpha/beta fold hydrolase n=1 Tax=Pseudomonas sp. Gutcm_11s TaxID=3026088 RepID=UPI00235E752F|nr:alpha/beta fold hydrolase [Pseudomonas sp. Gutcm_11s]MDD0842650.1 alpha/beta fold hydrolase [Pseudomonas sp. Gutcm_11s]
MPRLFATLLCTLLLSSGCTSPPPPEQRSQLATQLAQSRDWQNLQLHAGIFDLQSYAAKAQPAASDELTIYLEGDGLAWLSSRQPSADPTPLNPLALRLALAQPSGPVAYLGRPCQYLGAERPPCNRRYWTGARFAEEIVDSLDSAADQLKARAGARSLVLVGYSGGGALALLLAARRDDVRRVVTVAGNLDHAAWTQYHRVSPLSDSLNPADLRTRLGSVEQLHLLGGQDRVIPPVLVEAFVAGYPPGHRAKVRVVPEYDHNCCWAEQWPQLWQMKTD